eukprot:TRINITY_DN66218_c12_g2_i1.p2 TRINITY_DN66218_c12_g2~~TRINITY_DN66218_c12_g2_i1.p2  ORF type:complete len:412 (+),score=155.58 TRINITY_DN66218_c12_g2_i1:43-1278(+)
MMFVVKSTIRALPGSSSWLPSLARCMFVSGRCVSATRSGVARGEVPGWRRRMSDGPAIIEKFSRKQDTPVSLKEMFEHGKDQSPQALVQSAHFLWQELPIRLAKRVRELERLPYGLSDTAAVKKVRSWYVATFLDVITFPEPKSVDDDAVFTEMLEQILMRHANVVPTIARGIYQMKSAGGFTDDIRDCPYLNEFLDRFYMARIGIRFIMSQHIARHRQMKDHVGIINSKMDPRAVASAAVTNASLTCEKVYGIAPDVNIIGDPALRIMFVEQHLHHMLHEILKNSMRAVVEFHGKDADDYPSIDLIIADGPTDFSIKVSDEGGGISREQMTKVWTYLYTTADRPPELDDEATGILTAPMAGFGYGLPLSRLFARYFGGDLKMVSMEGHGTDAYIQLNKLGNSSEALPRML